MTEHMSYLHPGITGTQHGQYEIINTFFVPTINSFIDVYVFWSKFG